MNMVISTLYNIGDEPYIRECRVTDFGYVRAEIYRISISKSGDGTINIKYTLRYLGGGEWFQTDIWEDDLVRQDLAGEAMQSPQAVEDAE